MVCLSGVLNACMHICIYVYFIFVGILPLFMFVHYVHAVLRLARRLLELWKVIDSYELKRVGRSKGACH